MTTVGGEVIIPGPVGVLAGLRVWAAGYAADEAAVELLAVVAEDVPLLLDVCPVGVVPWLVPCPRPGVWALEGTRLGQALTVFPPRVRPLVAVIARLLSEGAEFEEILAGAQVGWFGPVCAAVAEAAGYCPAADAEIHRVQPPLTGLETAA